MNRLFVTVILGLHTVFSADARLCPAYVLDYANGQVISYVPGKLLFTWQVNPLCRPSKKDSLFVIIIEDIQRNLLLRDTVSGQQYLLNTALYQNIQMIFTIAGLDNTRHDTRLLFNEGFLPGSPVDEVDSISICLQVGFFHNALYWLERDYPKSMPEFQKQFAVMFPPNYPGRFDFFNCYLDKNSGKLVQMPFVGDFGLLEKGLNSALQQTQDKQIFIRVSVDKNGVVKGFETTGNTASPGLDPVIQNQNFINPFGSPRLVFIRLSRRKPGKKFEIINQRALTNPESANFQREFRPRLHPIM